MSAKKSKHIYLDHAATTPIDPRVEKEMLPYLRGLFGNPSSLHYFGRQSLKEIDEARLKTAKFFHCSPSEIVFTSGATESNNLAIRGVIKASYPLVRNPEIITTPIEHPSVINTCRDLEKNGVKIKYLPVKRNGIIDPRTLPKLVTPATVLITTMYANNEIGTIEPIAEIGQVVKRLNQIRKEKNPIIFHTDAVQAVPFLNCDVNYLSVDLLSFSGHKIYGPKGVGGLFVRQNTKIASIQTGGEQEYGLRAGTENLASIVGLGEALIMVKKNRNRFNKKMSILRDWLIKELKSSIPKVEIVGALKEKRLPNNVFFRIKGMTGEDLMVLFDQEAKIAVSTGSACQAGSSKPSSVLLSLGYRKNEAKEGIRVTLGKGSSKSELEIFLSCLKKFTKRK